jgi:hypothetical protein
VRRPQLLPGRDVELDGYPVTPIDTAIAAVTTHINITTHNRLYFQSGRAAAGMLVIKSDDVTRTRSAASSTSSRPASTTSPTAWRMPVFAVGKDDEITWQQIDSGWRGTWSSST